MNREDINLGITYSNDRTVISLLFSADAEITDNELAEALVNYAALLVTDPREATAQ